MVTRELRASARRKSTYRVRWWTAMIAMVASFFSLFFIFLGRGRGNLGQPLFALQTGYAFGLCLLAGVFLTADCLSEEKREGTLGLLFLTDLKGYDVVLGKFFAVSLNALYGLVALLPVTALPLLMGGITGGEFWRMSLALVNALFFSLSIGILISALARDPFRAMGSAMGLLFFFVAGLPALAKLLSFTKISGLWVHLGWASPISSYSYSADRMYATRPGDFWGALLISQFVSWLFLAGASFALPRCWQDQVLTNASEGRWSRWLTVATAGATKHIRRKPELLRVNPVSYLIGDEPALRATMWAMLAIWAVLVFVVGWFNHKEPMWEYWGAKTCGFIFKMLIAVQACRFFVETRRNGALEALLCTPLRRSEILRGQWLALRRLFLLPLGMFLLLNLVPIILYVGLTISGFGAAQIWKAIAGLGGGLFLMGWFTIGLVADIFAVCWFGMWLSLSMKKPNFAPPATIFFVLILPAFCFLDVIADLVFIIWGASKLQQDFRWVLMRHDQHRTVSYVPVARTSTVPAPPIVAR
jgi:ABC-type transport system involved in multi-copper enzyme maturation permease subunit